MTLSEQQIQNNLDILKTHSTLGTFKQITTSLNELNATPPASYPEHPFSITVENHQINLHSKRAPHAEAEKQVNSFLDSLSFPPEMIVVIGFAGLFHVEQLFQKVPQDCFIFIAEPSPLIVAQALHFRDWAPIFDNRKFFISSNPSLKTIANEFRKCLSQQKSFKNFFFLHPGSYRITPKLYEDLKELIHEETQKDAMNRTTTAYLSGEWQQHALSNLKHLLNASAIDCLKDKFKDKTAAIVAAGPSLDQSLPYLKIISEQLVIFCVGHALKPLQDAGIIPDFVVAVDSDPKTLTHYQQTHTAAQYLIAPPILFPELLQLFTEHMFIFSTPAISGVNQWLSKVITLPEMLSTGGTVTITAIDAACYAGSNRIFLFGFDLAYLNDGTTHAGNNVHTDNAKQQKLVTVPGNYNTNVYTSNQFAIYINMVNTHLWSITNNSSIQFYNVTSGGAKLDHVSVLKPEQINDYEFDKPFDKKKIIANFYKSNTIFKDKYRVIKHIELTLNELDELKELASHAETLCMELEISAYHDDKKMKELQTIEQEIKNRNHAKHLISTAIKPVIMHLFENSNISNATPAELMTKSRVFYQQVSQTADWLTGLLDSSKQAISNT